MCRAEGSTCIVADDALTLSAAGVGGGITYPSLAPNGANELRMISLATGVSQVVRSGTALFATPQVSPVTGDVVAQTGGGFGHLQTFTSSGSDLHLYQGLVQ